MRGSFFNADLAPPRNSACTLNSDIAAAVRAFARIYSNVGIENSYPYPRIGRAIANVARYAVDHIWLSLLRETPI